jgi:peptide deformylase
MIRKIVRVGHPALRKVSKKIQKIDKKIINLVKDLTDTLKTQKDPEGVGLSACQIGVNLRVFVMLKSKKIVPVINPEILEISEMPKKKRAAEEEALMEGCLSLPHYYSPLERAKKIKIKYQNIEGKDVVEEFSGFEAQIVQHEIDHLNGGLFVERVLEQKENIYKMNKGEWEEVELI